MKKSLTTVTVGAIVALACLHVSRTYGAGAQSLSADRERFKLAVHVETRQLPTYVGVIVIDSADRPTPD